MDEDTRKPQQRNFDPGPHHAILKHIAAAQKLFPEELNITRLLDKYFSPQGLHTPHLSTATVNKLPTLADSMKEKGFIALCPKCRAPRLKLFSLCRACKESAKGFFKTKLTCDACGYYEVSEKPVVEWLTIFKIDFKNQTKASLGIQTITDEGVK